MKTFVCALALTLVPLSVIADGIKVMGTVKKSVVFVTSENGQGTANGSGVIVMQDEILTNCHVVRDSKNISVQFSDGEKVPASVKGQVANLDMCLLSALTKKRPKTTIAPIENIKVGQAIYAVGNPMGLKFTISDGIVSSIRNSGSEQLIQISAPISPGSSGGGVFDGRGRLLGITTFTLSEGQNLNFAIPAALRNTLDVNPLVSSVAGKSDEATNSTPTTKAVTFKGVPFGADTKQLLALFPDASCEWIGGESNPNRSRVCRGGAFDYLGKKAEGFMAMFNSQGMNRVQVFFSADSTNSPPELYSYLVERITEHFGQSSTEMEFCSSKEPERGCEKVKLSNQNSWSVKTENAEYYIDTTRCDKKATMLGCSGPGAAIALWAKIRTPDF